MQGLLMRRHVVAKDAISGLARRSYTPGWPPCVTFDSLDAEATRGRLWTVTGCERSRGAVRPAYRRVACGRSGVRGAGYGAVGPYLGSPPARSGQARGHLGPGFP